jgi:hypothetical protein
MMESLQLPILAAALVVMSWAVIRLSSRATPTTSSLDVPTEVLRWQADLKQLSRELQAELDEKMTAVSALSQSYEEASLRLGSLIQQAKQLEEQLEGELAQNERVRLSA